MDRVVAGDAEEAATWVELLEGLIGMPHTLRSYPTLPCQGGGLWMQCRGEGNRTLYTPAYVYNIV
jgi:hypothetical protein